MLSFFVVTAYVSYSVAYRGCPIGPPPEVDSTNPGPGEYCRGTDGNAGVAGVPIRQVRTEEYPKFELHRFMAAMAKDSALFVLMFIASFTLQLFTLITALIFRIITTRCLCVTVWAHRMRRAWRMCLSWRGQGVAVFGALAGRRSAWFFAYIRLSASPPQAEWTCLLAWGRHALHFRLRFPLAVSPSGLPCCVDTDNREVDC